MKRNTPTDLREWEARQKALAPALRALLKREKAKRSREGREFRAILRLVRSAAWLAMLIEDSLEKGEQASGAEVHLVQMWAKLDALARDRRTTRRAPGSDESDARGTGDGR